MKSSLPRVSKKGFDLPGDAQILLFHGYTGTPYDLRMLGDFLHDHGFHVLAPLLLGHGTVPKNLNKVSFKDWVGQALALLHSLDKTRPIIVAGLSMGALLSVILAAQDKAIRGALLFSPAFKLTMIAELVIASAKIGLIEKKTSFKKLSGGSDVLDPEAKAKSPCYKEMPLGGLLEFEKLRKLALEKLPLVTCPIFMAFGKQDSAINATDSQRIALISSSAPIISKTYENSKHVITLDYDREQLFNDVFDFLHNHLGISS